jgi:hypothetical protein
MANKPFDLWPCRTLTGSDGLTGSYIWIEPFFLPINTKYSHPEERKDPNAIELMAMQSFWTILAAFSQLPFLK